jgi:hypothetical protein
MGWSNAIDQGYPMLKPATLKRLLAFLTPERQSALLVCFVGALVGVYAGLGMSLTQWAGGVLAVAAAVGVAVIVHTKPARAKARKP